MNRQERHSAVERAFSKGKCLGAGLDNGNFASPALGNHDRRGFHGDHVSMKRFIGAYPGTEVDNCANVGKFTEKDGCDSRVRTPIAMILFPDAIVQSCGHLGLRFGMPDSALKKCGQCASGGRGVLALLHL